MLGYSTKIVQDIIADSALEGTWEMLTKRQCLYAIKFLTLGFFLFGTLDAATVSHARTIKLGTLEGSSNWRSTGQIEGIGQILNTLNTFATSPN